MHFFSLVKIMERRETVSNIYVETFELKQQTYAI